MSHYHVKADFGQVGFTMNFRTWFFACGAAKSAVKNGAKVTIERVRV